MRVRSFILGCVVSAALIGCGGSDGGSAVPTCDTLDFSATGGDVVGQWQLVSACITVLENPYESWCSDASTSISIEDISAGAEFRSDGTLSKTGTATTVFNDDLAVTCLEDQGTTCADQEPNLVTLGYESVSCTENQARCKCTYKTTETAESGLLWKVEGTKLYTKKGDEDWDEGVDFMVDGNVMVRRSSSDAVMAYSIYERL